ncbi:MAG: ABC transporter substrate-binding protein [Bacteroidia bacterium]|nr:ABC transporter substrate-binding protein [Bacteroidia bacterium]
MRSGTSRNWLWILTAAVLGLSACRDSGQPDAVYRTESDGKVHYSGPLGDEVRVHLSGEPVSLHPLNSRDAARGFVLDLCYQHLLGQDQETGALIPELSGLPEISADRLRHTYRIDARAAWPDGAPVTASDVVFTLKAVACKHTDCSHVRSFLEYVQDVYPDPADPKAFTIAFTQHYIHNAHLGLIMYILDRRAYDSAAVLDAWTLPQLLDERSAANASPAVQAWAEGFNDVKYARDPAFLRSGSGPYLLESWTPKEMLVLKPRPSYWGKGLGGPAHSQRVPEIRFRIMSDDQAVQVAFGQQEFDVSMQLSALSYENMRTDSSIDLHYTLLSRPRETAVVLAMNLASRGAQASIFSDPRVRKAVALALPVDQMIESDLQGHGVRTASIIMRDNADYNQALKPLPYDPAASAALLDAAGWTDSNADGIRDRVIRGTSVPLSFTMMFSPRGQGVTEMADRIRNSLAEAGIQCELQQVPSTATVLQEHTFEVILTNFTGSSLPYDLKQLFHSSEWPKGNNFFAYANPKVDSLIMRSRVDTDPVLRKARLDELQAILLEDLPLVPLFNPTRRFALHRRYHNATVRPHGNYLYLNDLEVLR